MIIYYYFYGYDNHHQSTEFSTVKNVLKLIINFISISIKIIEIFIAGPFFKI